MRGPARLGDQAANTKPGYQAVRRTVPVNCRSARRFASSCLRTMKWLTGMSIVQAGVPNSRSLALGCCQRISGSRAQTLLYLDKEATSMTATGLYRCPGNPPCACVMEDKKASYVDAAHYRERGYRPDFESLPWEGEYRAAKEGRRQASS